MKKSGTLALFDFDGTITNCDTLMDFHKFVFGVPGFYLRLISVAHVLIGYLIKIISAQSAKEAVLRRFWNGKPVSDLKQRGMEYSERINNISRKEAMSVIQNHTAACDTVVLVTASVREWVEPWAISNGFDFVIASEMKTKDNLLIGTLSGKNCSGAEKVCRIKSCLNLSDFDEIYVYGDSRGDLEMFELGSEGKRYYKWRAI